MHNKIYVCNGWSIRHLNSRKITFSIHDMQLVMIIWLSSHLTVDSAAFFVRVRAFYTRARWLEGGKFQTKLQFCIKTLLVVLNKLKI